MIKKVIGFSALALCLAGCDTYGPEELGRLTKEDPQFKQMIAARDQVHAQIRLIKEDLLSKKKLMDAQIDKLRQEYDNYSKAQNVKIDKYQTAIEANGERLRREIDAADAQLASKKTELEGYQKTLSDVKKMLHEGKGITLSAQEKQKWQERMLMLSEKIRPLLDDIQELKLQTKLKKQKISFLK